MEDVKVNAAVIGLGFGTQFIPIYKRHLNANMYAVCRRSEKELNEIADLFGVEKRYTKYEDVLADPAVDYVHINTPIPDHAPMSIAALKAGKPPARHGRLARVLAGAAPHAHYATHRVGPSLALTRAEAEYVSCFGSGTIREELIPNYNSPFVIETTHIKFRNSDISARIYRSLFDTARQYRESFDVYGSKKTFEWPLIEGEGPVIHTAKRSQAESAERVGALLRPPAALGDPAVYDNAYLGTG